MSSDQNTSFELLSQECQTPAFVYDLNQFRSNIDVFSSLFPEFRIFYSTKTNPLDKLLLEINRRGLSYDAASLGEIDKLIGLGVPSENILFTHPIKFAHIVALAFDRGVRKFTFDSVEELGHLHENAPGSMFMMRILPPSEGKFYEYSDKFGANPKEVEDIFHYAIEQGIAISGICFHVGSQNMETGVWKDVLLYCKELFKRYYKAMPTLRILNIGSGFPARYQFNDCPTLEEFSGVIHQHLKSFPKDIEFWCEPGRVLVADAACMILSVIRSIQRHKNRWLFVNFGVYHGLIEILESRGKLTYKIESLKDGPPVKYNVSGNTLDPDDTLATEVMLPENLQMGDRVILHDVGAYTSMFFTHYHALPEPHYYYLNDRESIDYPENENVVVRASSTLESELGIYAKKSFKKGDLLFTVEGQLSPIRTMYSLQLTQNEHIEPIDEVGNFLWGHYLNHSCDGNVYVEPDYESKMIRVLARRDIAAGDEIAVDYATMESEISRGIVCMCDSVVCRGKIVGFKELTGEERQKYLDEGIIPGHLVES